MNSLSIISLAATILLFGIAIFIGIENRSEAVENRTKLENLERQFAQKEDDFEKSSIESRLLAESAAEKEGTIESLKAQLASNQQDGDQLDARFQAMLDQKESQETPLTPQQRKIRAAAAIAKVTDYHSEMGFVALDAGTNQNLEPGMRFQLRRDKYIIGEITIGDTIENMRSIADVIPESVSPGITIEPGDEVVQYIP